jgi:hypothetical protein
VCLFANTESHLFTLTCLECTAADGNGKEDIDSFKEKRAKYKNPKTATKASTM